MKTAKRVLDKRAASARAYDCCMGCAVGNSNIPPDKLTLMLVFASRDSAIEVILKELCPEHLHFVGNEMADLYRATVK